MRRTVFLISCAFCILALPAQAYVGTFTDNASSATIGSGWLLVPAAAEAALSWRVVRSEIRESVRASVTTLLQSVASVLPRLLAATLIILLFAAIAYVVRWFGRSIVPRFIKDATVENLFKQLVYYSVWTIGLIIAAGALGFDAQTVITGLGLTGLALGFALRDIISNFVSGILLLVLRPFQIGDQIVVGATEGAVERIELRATHIRAYDGRLNIVPNTEVFTSRVINNTASPQRGGTVLVHLGYEVDLRRAIEVITQATRETAGVRDTPANVVLVRELTGGGIELETRFWTDSHRRDFMSTTSAVRESVLQALKGQGMR